MKRKKLWMTSIIVMTTAVIVGVFGTTESVQSQSEGRGEHQNEGHEGGREASESSGEGCPTDEHGAESGREGSDSSEGRGAKALALDESYDATRNGARLVMRYDAASRHFVGAVENAGDVALTRVRVEVHLSNGRELGPTRPTDLDPGEVLDIALPAGARPFATWIPHAEVGLGEGCGESSDPSSPVLALDESWDGAVNGVRTAMSYDSAAGLFSGTVENAGNQTLCAVQIELNLKQRTTTVVELGPQPIGDLAPGAQMPIELWVADEPLAVGLAFDAWQIHPEVFDCGDSVPANTESGEERGEHGNGEGRGG